VTSTNVFALKHSDLNAFLFADVGVESNGSALTVLSVLARLGQDPWIEAARLANMPKPAAAGCLSQCIGKMPLCPQDIAESRAIASRLVRLLPLKTHVTEQRTSGAASAPGPREWVPMALLCLSLFFVVVFNIMSAPVSPARATAPAAQTVQHIDPVKSK
jgi:hypothetical protein